MQPQENDILSFAKKHSMEIWSVESNHFLLKEKSHFIQN